MLKFVHHFLSLGLILMSYWLSAQNSGEIAVIGFNADGNDDLAKGLYMLQADNGESVRFVVE